MGQVCALCAELGSTGEPANDRIVAPDMNPSPEAWLCLVHVAAVFRRAA